MRSAAWWSRTAGGPGLWLPPRGATSASARTEQKKLLLFGSNHPFFFASPPRCFHPPPQRDRDDGEQRKLRSGRRPADFRSAEVKRVRKQIWSFHDHQEQETDQWRAEKSHSYQDDEREGSRRNDFHHSKSWKPRFEQEERRKEPMLKGQKRSAAEEVLHRDQEYLYGVRPVEAAFSNALLLLQQQQVSTEPQTTATRTPPPPSTLPLRRISKLFLLDKPLSPSSSSFSQQSKEERQEEEATVAGEESRRGEGGGGAKEGSKLAKKGTSKHQAVLQWLEAAAKKELGIPVERVDRRRMEELVGPNNVHQGVVAKVSKLKAKEVPFLEAEEEKEEKERRMSRERKPLWLVLAEIWDPHNVGAILRTAAFFGVDGVILSAKNSSPLTAHVSKASAGALESMQLYSTRNILRFLAESKKRGWKVFGASSALSNDDDAAEKPEEEGEVNTAETKESRENAAKSLQEVSDRDAPSILVVGNEGYGLRKQVIKMCDVLLHIDQAIPLHPRQHLDSLNVSVATGVLLFQLTSTK
ncbi:23S rRNA (Guanosine(2251)-2'-O)-methyltransferase RlmB [Balamuthia mandrillaris]